MIFCDIIEVLLAKLYFGGHHSIRKEKMNLEFVN